MDSATTYEVGDGVATITLNRANARNVLSVDLVNSLADHLELAIADPTARVIVLTNNGSTFCAGADLSAPTRTVEPSDEHRSFVDVLELIIASPTPVIGRINGHCMGGGVGLAATCDISIASTEARFGFTEVRLGVAPAIISVVCLPKLKLAGRQRTVPHRQPNLSISRRRGRSHQPLGFTRSARRRSCRPDIEHHQRWAQCSGGV